MTALQDLEEPAAQLFPRPDLELQAEIGFMYAEQMHLLDDGKGAAWAETFTEEGIFEANAQPAPTVGRDAISVAAQSVADDLTARGITRRHWLGMLAVRRTGADTAVARSYALIIFTPRGGEAVIRCSTSCTDDLVRVDGRWLVAHRRVRRDDLE